MKVWAALFERDDDLAAGPFDDRVDAERFVHGYDDVIADHLNRRTPAPSTPTPPAGTSDAGNEKENEG